MENIALKIKKVAEQGLARFLDLKWPQMTLHKIGNWTSNHQKFEIWTQNKLKFEKFQKIFINVHQQNSDNEIFQQKEIATAWGLKFKVEP